MTWPPFLARVEKLLSVKKIAEKFGIQIVLVYISEAHVDDLWPINAEFYLKETKVNCKWYSGTEQEKRK
jgi:hypothetical protein